MGKRSFADKLKRRLWRVIVQYSKNKRYYPLLYKSYWHFLFYKKYQTVDNSTLYYTARPNPGAGVGHQMANWIAGYWWAKQFGLEFAHTPFANKKWDNFLGLGEGELTVNELKKQGYKVRKLPLFIENSKEEIDLQKKIISSYAGQKVVFLAEQDQGYKKQCGVMEDLQRKFYSAPARQKDKLIYDDNHYNIAVHIRRGDIMSNPSNPNLIKRILGNDYYSNVLKKVLEIYRTEKESHIYLFSQGEPEDFPEFKEFQNLHWCFDMCEQQSFLHMVYADLLITSKSSFSYKPALLNKGIKVCPIDFWHGYPNTDDWMLCDGDGRIVNRRDI